MRDFKNKRLLNYERVFFLIELMRAKCSNKKKTGGLWKAIKPAELEFDILVCLIRFELFNK